MSEAALQERFVALVDENPVNREIFRRLPDLGVADCWVVAGCLFGTVWNALSDRPLTENIRDYDIFYFDPETSYEAEDAVIRRGEALFGDLAVEIEIRNQARVPLWYEQRFGVPYPPIFESRTGIERFVVAGTCCGISSEGEVFAPYGFADMIDGTSNTMLIGEKQTNPKNFGGSGGDNEPWANSGWDQDQIRWADPNYPPASDFDHQAEPPTHWSSRFGSSHVGIFNALRVDGSVRSLSYNIDKEMFRRLAVRNDGLVVEVD